MIENVKNHNYNQDWCEQQWIHLMRRISIHSYSRADKPQSSDSFERQNNSHWLNRLMHIRPKICLKFLQKINYHCRKWPYSSFICLHEAIKLMNYMFKLNQKIIGKMILINSLLEQVSVLIAVYYLQARLKVFPVEPFAWLHSECRLLGFLANFTLGWKWLTGRQSSIVHCCCLLHNFSSLN